MCWDHDMHLLTRLRRSDGAIWKSLCERDKRVYCVSGSLNRRIVENIIIFFFFLECSKFPHFRSQQPLVKRSSSEKRHFCCYFVSMCIERSVQWKKNLKQQRSHIHHCFNVSTIFPVVLQLCRYDINGFFLSLSLFQYTRTLACINFSWITLFLLFVISFFNICLPSQFEVHSERAAPFHFHKIAISQ